MRKLPIMIIMGLLLAYGCGGGETHEKASDQEDVYAEIKDEIVVSERGRGFHTLFTGRLEEEFNDSNYIQYQSAERLGIDPIETLYEAYNTRRPLIKIESGRNYQVDKLTHSMPYLVPEAARLLDDIGEEFGNLVEQRGGDRDNNCIIVTSVLRSPYTVKKLRRVNRNAVDSSTHMFATTFDISWNNFYYRDSMLAEDPGVLKGILGEVLKKKRDEGRCYVKYEKKSPCFHITVRK